MFSFMNNGNSFQSQLESSMVRSGPRALAYADSNRYIIKKQILVAHQDTRYSNLKLRELDHRVGAGRKVLSLEGTIPITHQNGHFNIPVEVVLPPDFPHAPPEVFVRPTATMQVAEGHPYVEKTTGAVNTPSIVSWSFPSSNLTSCLTELSARFGEQSPVYAKPAGSTQHSPAQQSSVSSFPVQSPYGSTQPAQNSGYSTPYSPMPANHGTDQNPYSAEPSNPYTTNPLRPSPSSNTARPPNAARFPGYPAASGAGASGYPPANPYITPAPGRAGGAAGGASVPFPYGPGSAAVAAEHAAAGGAPNPPPPDKTASIAEFRRAAVQSLSERIVRSIEQSEHLIAEETDQMLEQTGQVEENRKVISDACSEKKSELRSLERNVTALSSATQALHGWIKVNEAKVAALPENVSPSNVIVPVDDLSEGAIAAQAEDMAIEESLQVLQEALKGRAADLEVVMRLGRELAQQQFYCRAVGAKLQQKQRERHARDAQSSQAHPQAGVLLPMGDAWSRVATYEMR